MSFTCFERGGKTKTRRKTMDLLTLTFPTGTLTKAPKHKAMMLTKKNEKTNRNFCNGTIGFMDFNGNFNHAILIRTFLSKNHQLHYQAGAGIVESSSEENEMKEAYNKVNELIKAS